jgi:hypothetical protein
MEYFIVARSFAAPFFSDESTHYVDAESAEAALEGFAETYSHPAGLYAANAYASADSMHKGEPRLAQWLSNHEQAKQEKTADYGSFSYLGEGPGRFRINGELVEVEDPKGGSVV